MQNQTKLFDVVNQKNIVKIAATLLFAIAIFFAPTATMASPLNNSVLSTDLLAAANRSTTTYPTNDKDMDGLLYSDSKAESLNSVDDFVSPQTQKELLDPGQIPAKKQPILDRSDPDAKLLEKTGQMFKDATDFSEN